MADYDLKYTGAQIDGLLDAANELKTNGFIYKGVATPSTNPGTPTERVAYLASEPGTYTNFGGIVIASGLYSLTYASGTWTATQMSAGSDIEVVQTTGDSTTDVMSQKAVTDEFIKVEKDTTELKDVSYTYIRKLIWYIMGDGKIYNSSSFQAQNQSCCFCVDVSNCNYFQISANSNGEYYAFLKSFKINPTTGETPDWCVGYESRYYIGANQTALLRLPSDCKYMYFYDGINTAYRPISIKRGYSVAVNTQINDQIIDDLKTKLSEQKEVVYADETGYDGYLYPNGTWRNTSSYPLAQRHRSVVINVKGCLSFSYIAGENGISYAFLPSWSLPQHDTLVELCVGTHLYTDSDVGISKTVALPYGCQYLYIYDGIIRSARPTYLSRGYAIKGVSAILNNDIDMLKGLIAQASKGNSIDPNGRVYPDDVTILNVERRSSQMLDIQWTALLPIPSTTSTTGITAGLHTGLPYTSCMEVDRFVGYDVTLLTFMTASNNQYSLLYTEDLKRNISGYGFTYHGTRNTIGGYMGIVCNIFALGSIGMEIPFDTGMFAWLAEQGIFTKIYDQSAQGVRIGDIIWETGHGNVVTDLWRNQRGEVTYVDWSESIADFPRTTHMTPAQFNNRLATNTGIIYRYNELYKNIKYTPSPFVSVDGETPQSYTYNDDICTFAGDYACFRVGFPIYINYNLKSVGTWSTMQLYKGNSLLNTYNLDISSHRLSLGSSLTAGKYKARLANGSTYSDYTYFEVIETTVSYSDVGENIKKVTFESSNGTPMYVRCSGVDGAPMCLYPLTDEDIANGYCEVNFKSLIQKQYNNLSTHTGNVYCKVTFKGEYGRVTNEPILTDL